jgi:REP element-mobilizing transposase RayT
MPQSLTKQYSHIVFSTKNRQKFITNKIKDELYSYIAGILKSLKSPAIVIGGMDDHVHILCILSKNHSTSKIVEEIKKNSSKWIKTKGISNFFWQRGYAAFSISQSHVEIIQKYINTQVEHHKNQTFKDEFRLLLQKYNIDFDERYVWD